MAREKPTPTTFFLPAPAGIFVRGTPMKITADTLAAISGRAPNANMRSTIHGLQMAGVGAGLVHPHRLAQFFAQLSHESAGWQYDREIWGPTAAQKRYDVRTDLGNTPERDGDGFLYRGRGPIQLTGKSNYAQFTAWARKMDSRAPDFVANPDAVLTDPWEGLVPIWYWDSRNLNAYADRGDLLTITKRINGGTNGLADRQARYAFAALVLLGHSRGEVRQFQRAHGLTADGIAGPATRAAMHKALSALPPVRFAPVEPTPPPRKPAMPKDTATPAPVAQDRTDISTVPPWLFIVAFIVALAVAIIAMR